MNTTLPEGTVFAGRYRIVRQVAAGGMGAIYEAVHLETERRRALKVMHAHLFHSDELRERFKLEARIASHIESEHIVDVSDAGIDEATGMPFLVMELLRGEDLGVRLKRLGRLPPAEVLTFMQQAAMALDRTHASSIVHRDLKPDNLFLTHREDGTPRIKILDFGVAKIVAESATGGATRSLGTPLYMAPEQFRMGTRLTPAADIHALGMMTYTLLVGEPYWGREGRDAGNVVAFALVAVRGPDEAATRRAAALGVVLPSGFDAWFARATHVDPTARFATASEATRALAAALAGAPAELPAPPAVAGAFPVRTPAPAEPQHARASATSSSTSSSTGGAVLAPLPAPRRAPLVVAGLAGLAVVAALAAVGGWAISSRSSSTPATGAAATQAPAAAATQALAAPAPPAPAPESTMVGSAPGIAPAGATVVAASAEAPPVASAAAPPDSPAKPALSPGKRPRGSVPVSPQPSTTSGARVPVLGRD